MKKLIISVCLICFFKSGIAQKKQNVYFYKNNNSEVSVKDSADFVRIIQEPDSGSVYYNLFEFYPDGKRKTLGTVSAFEPFLKYEGQRVSYYKNGNKKSVEVYEKNERTGTCYYYYDNDTCSKSVSYKLAIKKNTGKAANAFPSFSGELDSIVIYMADSLGHVMVQEGEGHVIESLPDYGGSIVEGDFKRGYKHGTWVLKSKSGEFSYREEFKDGVFISGESEKNGVKSTYTLIDTPPDFKGGTDAFYSYLRKNVRYPRDAQQHNIQGKVFLSYVVDVDGTVTDIKLDHGLYPSLDEESVRVLKACPKWKPGMKHGFPVKVQYNIPVSFSLTSINSDFRGIEDSGHRNGAFMPH